MPGRRRHGGVRGRAAGWACPAYEVIASALRPAIRGMAGPVPGVLAQIMPELGAPPAEPSPAAVAAAVCSMLAAGGGRGRAPVLFLDDLQWADEATLGFLPALADAAAGLPVAVVGCYRSDELPRGHHLRTVRALLRRNHQLAEIELGPLGDDDVARMLTGLLGAPPQPALAAVVASRSDGLPFAVEELAFALRDAGRLAYRDGTVALAGSGAAPVPDGIREAVLLRASRLTDTERALLAAAAVAGTEFDTDIVLAVAGMATWPDGFTGSGLLTEARDGRAAFRHPLTQEAAYADIPWSRRRRLHRAHGQHAGRPRCGAGADRRAPPGCPGLRARPAGAARGGRGALRGTRVPRRRPCPADGAGTLAAASRTAPAAGHRPARQVRRDVLGVRRRGHVAARARRWARAARRQPRPWPAPTGGWL